MHLTLRHFELVQAVHSHGSITLAAKVLGMSQPALSRRLQALEAMVGASLLERTTRRVGPTPIGLSFAPLARRVAGLPLLQPLRGSER